MKLAQGLQRRSRLKMLTDGRTDGRMDDGRKVITIAHPEHSSGELKSSLSRAIMYKYNTVDWVTLIFSLQDHK